MRLQYFSLQWQFNMGEEAGSKLFTEHFKLYTREELTEKFGWEEYLVFALMLAISLVIGIYFAWKGQKNNAEFLLGGQNMGTFPMAMSLVARYSFEWLLQVNLSSKVGFSFISANTLLGTPAEIYRNGTQYVAITLSYPFVMASTVYCYLPVFWELKVSTSYEYLNWRFNKAVRLLGSSCFMLQMILYMAIVVYTPALALSQSRLTKTRAFHCQEVFAYC